MPIAAARCIGIESTPTKSRARAVSAPSSLMRELAGEVERLGLRLGQDLVDQLRLVGRRGHHHPMAFGGEAIDQLGVLLRRPAFEAPARGRVQVDERPARQAACPPPARPRAPGTKMHLSLIERGLHADAPQRIEVHLDHVAARRQRVEVGEAALPRTCRGRPSSARRCSARRACARATRRAAAPTGGRSGRSARARSALEQARFLRQTARRRLPTSTSCRRRAAAQRRVALEHRRGVVVDQRIDLQSRARAPSARDSTGAASSTSPWCRSFSTSARPHSPSGTASFTIPRVY